MERNSKQFLNDEDYQKRMDIIKQFKKDLQQNFKSSSQFNQNTKNDYPKEKEQLNTIRNSDHSFKFGKQEQNQQNIPSFSTSSSRNSQQSMNSNMNDPYYKDNRMYAQQSQNYLPQKEQSNKLTLSHQNSSSFSIMNSSLSSISSRANQSSNMKQINYQSIQPNNENKNEDVFNMINFDQELLENEGQEDYCLQQIIKSLKKGDQNSKSLSQILYLLRKGSKKIVGDDKEAILVFGNTGSGKTTISAYLSENELQIKLNENEEQYLDYKYIENSKLGKIGKESTSSETFIPNKFQNKSKTLTIWDCPGFGDSRGVNVDIVNSYFIQKLLHSCQGLKLIIMIDGSYFEQQGFGSEKGESNKQLFETLYYLTQNSKIDFSKNLIIMFNKTSNDISFFKDKLKHFFNNLSNSKNYNERINGKLNCKGMDEFYNSVLKAQFIAVPYPVDQGENEQFGSKEHRQQLLNVINRSSYYYQKDFIIPFSIKSLDKIKQLWNFARQTATELFEQLCYEIQSVFDTFNGEQFNKMELILNSCKMQTNQEIAQSNKQAFNILITKFFKPIIEVLKISTETQRLVQSQNLFKTIDDKISAMDFFFTEIYDGLLAKLQVSKEISQFLGKISSFETKKGFKLLKLQYDSSLQKYQQKQMIKEKEKQNEMMEIQINNLNKQSQNLNEYLEKQNELMNSFKDLWESKQRDSSDLKRRIQEIQEQSEKEREQIKRFQDKLLDQQQEKKDNGGFGFKDIIHIIYVGLLFWQNMID